MEIEEVSRKNIKRRKRKRRGSMILIVLLLLMLSTVSAATFYISNLYNEEKAKLSEVNEKLRVSEQNYIDLKQSLDEGGFITIDEADKRAEAAAEDMSDEYRKMIRGYMEGGDGTLTMLENIYSDMIVVPDIGRYRFFDIENDLAKSELDFDAFIYPEEDKETSERKGNVRYDDGVTQTKFGVDVSKFQGAVDWEKVKSDGIDFAYIRLGYRGYESGKIVIDDKYEDNISGCNEVGMDCGVYFFTEAKNAEEGREEAEFVLENLGDYHVELPIVIDIEQSANVAKSRTKNVIAADRTKAIIAFCERVKEAGYEPMIYGNLKSFMIMLNINELEDYDKWFAYYSDPLRFPYKIKIWQFRSDGHVNGIKGDADINIMFY